MYDKVCRFVSDNKLIENGDRIVVGVSGGADSVCLLNILHRISREKDIRLIAIHINHGIRGEEADADEEYVYRICAEWDIEFHSYSYDVKGIAAAEGLSEEEAGRKVRYQSFYDACDKYRCNKIAVAHNKNDNAETFVFNLLRGSGIKGLAGIKPFREVTDNLHKQELVIIRPLLCVERREIEDYLSEQGISYRTDSTNLSDEYSRNKIRNRILAYAACEINPQTVKNIHEASLKLHEALAYIEDNIALCFERIVRNEDGCYRIPVDKLLPEPAIIQKGLIRHIIEVMTGRLRDIESKHVDAILALCGRQVGKNVQLPYGIIAEREYDNIFIYHKDREIREDFRVEPVTINIPGVTYIPYNGMSVITELFQYKKDMQIPKNSCVKWFDYDKIKNAVVLRSRREGDYLCINSSGGIKKLKDYFIDTKLPKKQRDSQLLITDGKHVMWITGAGNRISEYYKINDNTQKVLLIRLMEGDYHGGQNKSNDTGRTDRDED
jgi:tRNA(Ile)-lysidine synthase